MSSRSQTAGSPEGAPRRLLRSALRVLLAVGLVLVVLAGGLFWVLRQPVWGRHEVELSVRADPGHLEQDVRWLVETRAPRNSDHPEVLDALARGMAERLEAAGGRVRLQSYEARGHEYRNVIASYGPEEGPRLVIGAHYDVFGPLPGADDNASGTAGILELGRLLGQLEEPLPLRVDLVAYTLEEPPFFGSELMGSARHAASLREAGVAVEGMICLEMIGYAVEEQRFSSWVLNLLYPDEGDFIAVVGRWEDRSLARRVKKGILSAGRTESVSLTIPVLGGMDLSDHRNYWAAGWEAVMVTDTAYERNPWYHTSRDTPDTLDYEMMAGTVDGVLATILAWPPP